MKNSKEEILSILQKRKGELSDLGISQIGLFGSYARGEQSVNSDIDILIDFKPGAETFDNYMSACELIDKFFGRSHVEVVTKNGLSPHIGPLILKETIYA
jgi:uncharacterized protein